MKGMLFVLIVLSLSAQAVAIIGAVRADREAAEIKAEMRRREEVNRLQERVDEIRRNTDWAYEESK